jgi:hypothetical protein
VQVGDVLTSAAPSMSDQVTSSRVVGILTFTSNLIKSRINKGVTLMEIHGEFGKCDKYYDSPGTATDVKTGVICVSGKAHTRRHHRALHSGVKAPHTQVNKQIIAS